MVDDLLPTSGGGLIFDHIAPDKAMWGPMMEKVWAKINGNYENIVAGNSLEAFSLILGAPGQYFSMTGSAIGYVATNSSTIKTAAANAWKIIS